MWWLDQIQKKLDDVAGIVNGEEDEEGEEDNAWPSDETPHKELVNKECVDTDSVDASVSQPQQSTPPHATPLSSINGKLNKIAVEAIVSMSAVGTTVPEKPRSCTPIASSEVELQKQPQPQPPQQPESDPQAEHAERPLPTASPPVAKPAGAEDEQSTAKKKLPQDEPPAPISAFVEHLPVPAGLAPASPDSAAEAHLLRFQRQLAEEMEAAARLRDENQQLRHSIAALEREAAALRQFKRNAAAVDPSRLTALEREGTELSEQLGLERERTRSLQEERAQLQSRITALEAQLQSFSAARSAAADLAAQLAAAERSQRDAEQQAAALFADALQREKAAHEAHTQSLEQCLAQAHRRADEAESRLTALERAGLAPLRELRAALDDAARQRQRIAEEAEAAREQCALLRRELSAEQQSGANRLEALQREAQTAQEERDAAQRELRSAKARHAQALREAQLAADRAARLEAAGDQLAAALEDARLSRNSGAGDTMAEMGTPMKAKPPQQTQAPKLSAAVASVVVEPSGGGASAVGIAARIPMILRESVEEQCDGGRGRGRAERELVRQAMEIERLRRVEEEAKGTARKLAELAAQHDLMLQMYGQLQEEVQQQQQQQQQQQERELQLQEKVQQQQQQHEVQRQEEL